MRYYTADDIKEFLEQEVNGLKWNKEVRDGLTVRKVIKKDLENNVIKLKIYHETFGECYIPISVTNLQFLIYNPFEIEEYFGKFEKEWIELLIKNHKNDYSKFLTEYVNSQKIQIREDADKSIENFIKTTNEGVEKKFKVLDGYFKMANKALSETSPAELGEE